MLGPWKQYTTEVLERDRKEEEEFHAIAYTKPMEILSEISRHQFYD